MMADIKLTKSELRLQQHKLLQLQKYLPTLQLKKAMLQAEVNLARQEIAKLEDRFGELYNVVSDYSALLCNRGMIHPESVVKIVSINKRYENIAGIEVPYFESIIFEDFQYSLFETPPWIDGVIAGLRSVVEARVSMNVAEEKKSALEKELREVSIRVNLFDKILIPRLMQNIKRIKVFLGDQQLAAVSQAKAAKGKIEKHKELLASVEEDNLQESVYAD